MREPTEREILEVMDALLGFYAKELKASHFADDKLTMRRVRVEAERACRAFLAAGPQLDPSKPVPRWVTSWPDWYGIHGNTQVVPASDYDALAATLPPDGNSRQSGGKQ